jgi:basic amino acid/polyamine antiporter, APA family
MHWKDLFATKSLAQLDAEAKGENRLRRVLGPIGLTSLGIGAIIGSGIFVMTGEMTANAAGPSILLSFVITGVCCALAALCYAEFASMAPVAGSAYTYAYTTLGELFAWIIGWDLILEYAMSAAVVAASWSKYFNRLTDEIFGWHLPHTLSNDPFAAVDAGWFNLPAVVILLLVTAVLVVGIRESAMANTTMVAIKIGVVLFVIIMGLFYFNKDNWTEIPDWYRRFPEEHLFATEAEEYVKKNEGLKGHALNERQKALIEQTTARHKIEIAGRYGTAEQIRKVESRYAEQLPSKPEDVNAVESILRSSREDAPKEAAKKWGVLGLLGVSDTLAGFDDKTRNAFFPYGISGVMFGAAMLFFVYLGFDSVSTHAEEAVKPARDVPFGIIASLVLCTLLYMGVAAVLIGLKPYVDIDAETGVASAFEESKFAKVLISLGALAGMTSVLLITLLSQARIFLAMARDGLLPHRLFGTVHPRFRTPHVSTILTGVSMAVVAALTPITALEEMVNIGTYLAFIIVCAAVWIMRHRYPDANRPFRCPLINFVAPAGILINLLMMLFLGPHTWERLFIWLGIGLLIYLLFGYHFSLLRLKPLEDPTAIRKGLPPGAETGIMK